MQIDLTKEIIQEKAQSFIYNNVEDYQKIVNHAKQAWKESTLSSHEIAIIYTNCLPGNLFISTHAILF